MVRRELLMIGVYLHCGLKEQSHQQKECSLMRISVIFVVDLKLTTNGDNAQKALLKAKCTRVAKIIPNRAGVKTQTSLIPILTLKLSDELPSHCKVAFISS
jgi:hypothetical protein